MQKELREFVESLVSRVSTPLDKIVALLTLTSKRRKFCSTSSTKEKQRQATSRGSSLHVVWMTNFSAATDYYLLVLDKSGPAANGDIPKLAMLVPLGQSGFLEWPNEEGRPFEEGIVFAASTTGDYVTLPATNDVWFDSVLS